MMSFNTPIPYNKPPIGRIKGAKSMIEVFTKLDIVENIDKEVVNAFGEEWTKFTNYNSESINQLGNAIFKNIDERIVNKDTYMIDIGCGSGRWSTHFVDKAGFIESVDPSDAVYVADNILSDNSNVRVTKASVSTLPWSDETFDFGMSIGVLHHIPDTKQALIDCVKKIKRGGYFYVYLYYRFDDRGVLFKAVFYLTNLVRLVISRMPEKLKKITCDILAVVIYWPVSRFAGLLKKLGFRSLANKIPLEPYSNRPLYSLRNDSLDRFGTKLEQRFLRSEIEAMMVEAGLTDIQFREDIPKWHALGRKK